MKDKPHYNVVAAVIMKNVNGSRRIFCARRPGPKPGREPAETDFKWEFPGGKIEEGESRESALEREIFEEFGAGIRVGKFIGTVEHEYRNFSITMHGFCCTLEKDDGILELREHLEGRWVLPCELMDVDFAAADVPFAHKVLSEDNWRKLFING